MAAFAKMHSLTKSFGKRFPYFETYDIMSASEKNELAHSASGECRSQAVPVI